MSYQANVTAAASALTQGEDANWELAILTYENTRELGRHEQPGRVTMTVWCADVALMAERSFAVTTGQKYRRIGDTYHGTDYHNRPAWAVVWNEIQGRTGDSPPTDIPPPIGKYRCIVIDPPWPMPKIVRDVRPRQGEHLDYPTMKLDQIAALKVRELADDAGCHLYLWTTQKYVPKALAIAEGWGFKYQCLLTWVKPTGMTPYSWMYNTEHVIFAGSGNQRLTKRGLKLSFEAASKRHSAKPDVFYERVVLASPGPRLEMFARVPRDGFTVWGNEVLDASA